MGEDSHIIVIKSALDEFCDPAGQHIQIEYIGDLGAHPADKGQLLNAPLVHSETMRSHQRQRYMPGQPFQEFDFFFPERLGRPPHLERTHSDIAIFKREGKQCLLPLWSIG